MKKLWIMYLLLLLNVQAVEQIVEETSDGLPPPDSLEFVDQMQDIYTIQDVFFQKKLGINKTVQNLIYDKDKTIYIRTRLAMNSFIFFPEPVKNYTIGDSSFKLALIDAKIPASALSVRPTVYSKVDTNLIVVGVSGRVYSFYVWSTKYDHTLIPNLKTYITLKQSKQEKIDKLKKLEFENEELAKKLGIKHRPIYKTNLGELDFSYSIKGDEQRKIAAVFRNLTHTFIALNTGQIPTIKNVNEEEMSFSKKGKIIALKSLDERFYVSFGKYNEIVLNKKNPYFQEDTNQSIDVSRLEFNYNMKVRFNGFFASLFPKFDKNHYDVKRFTPIMIFNDDRFTFFKFDLSRGDKNLPVVYKVADEKDILINTSVIGSYIQADILSHKFTLRVGEKHLCIDKE